MQDKLKKLEEEKSELTKEAQKWKAKCEQLLASQSEKKN